MRVVLGAVASALHSRRAMFLDVVACSVHLPGDRQKRRSKLLVDEVVRSADPIEWCQHYEIGFLGVKRTRLRLGGGRDAPRWVGLASGRWRAGYPLGRGQWWKKNQWQGSWGGYLTQWDNQSYNNDKPQDGGNNAGGYKQHKTQGKR